MGWYAKQPLTDIISYNQKLYVVCIRFVNYRCI